MFENSCSMSSHSILMTPAASVLKDTLPRSSALTSPVSRSPFLNKMMSLLVADATPVTARHARNADASMRRAGQLAAGRAGERRCIVIPRLRISAAV